MNCEKSFGGVSSEKVWEDLGRYEEQLQKTSRKWEQRSGFRFDRRDIYGELLIEYHNIRKAYSHLEDFRFVKVLAVCLRNRCVKMMTHKDNDVRVRLDDIEGICAIKKYNVAACDSSFVEDVKVLAKYSGPSSEILEVILSQEGQLTQLRKTKNETLKRKQREIRKQDICQVMLERGMRITDYRVGMRELKRIVQMVE